MYFFLGSSPVCLISSFVLLLTAAFGFKSEASYKDDRNANEPNPQNEMSDPSGFQGIPDFLVKMYLANAKDDGTLKGNSKRIPPTVQGIIGHATQENNAVFFNLSHFEMKIKEPILSAKMRLMVETTGPLPLLPWRGRLVLYDGFSQRLIHSVAFQRGGARWVEFPVRCLVKRWLFSQNLNRGVFFMLKSHNPDMKASLTVRGEEAGTRLSNRPLLIVQTRSSQTLQEEMLYTESENQALLSKMAKRTRRSRSPGVVVRDEGPCSIRTMNINVRRHLNLNDVLFPRDIESFRCGGKCTFPLDASVNPSEHAIIRAILHSAGLDKGAGEPCCTPIKLRGVSVFLQESPDVIKIKSFQEMIVEECGCR